MQSKVPRLWQNRFYLLCGEHQWHFDPVPLASERSYWTRWSDKPHEGGGHQHLLHQHQVNHLGFNLLPSWVQSSVCSKGFQYQRRCWSGALQLHRHNQHWGRCAEAQQTTTHTCSSTSGIGWADLTCSQVCASPASQELLEQNPSPLRSATLARMTQTSPISSNWMSTCLTWMVGVTFVGTFRQLPILIECHYFTIRFVFSHQECCQWSLPDLSPTLSSPWAQMGHGWATTAAPICWTSMRSKPAMASSQTQPRTPKSSARLRHTSTTPSCVQPIPSASTGTWTWRPASGSSPAITTCQSCWMTAEVR